MAKQRQQFICQQCGTSYGKWSGRCDNCGEWNTLVEQVVQTTGKSAVMRSVDSGNVLEAQSLKSVSEEETLRRFSTGFKDLDDVLGGGVLPGGVTLLAGQPGIGKSTLLLQVTSHIAKDLPVL